MGRLKSASLNRDDCFQEIKKPNQRWTTPDVRSACAASPKFSMNREKIRSALRNATPPIIWGALQALKGRSRQNYFSGDYRFWADAVRESGGYSADGILAASRTRHALYGNTSEILAACETIDELWRECS